MQWDPSNLHPGVDADTAAGDTAGTATGIDVDGDAPRRLRQHLGICGALQTPYETRPNAVDSDHQLPNLHSARSALRIATRCTVAPVKRR